MLTGLCLAAGLAIAPTAAGAADFFTPVSGPLPATHDGRSADVTPNAYSAFTLNSLGLKSSLAAAPKIGLKERASATAQSSDTILSIPAPDGTIQRFRVENSPVMVAGLAAKHPEIQTYAGVGIDDPTATVRADTSPLGFHASVRSDDKGYWYVDPYYHLDTSTYVSYYGSQLTDDPHGVFVERDAAGDNGDPLDLGVKAAAADPGAAVTLRTYRLALVTDPTYTTYFGGTSANTTAAKVTLMNRVDQIYEDELAIRMVLINDLDKINFTTTAMATAPNGPCGAAACYTATQLSTCGSSTLNRNRIVLGQIIGAANYDIGHIGLGNPGGGIASLGVVGGNSKGQGCTGLPTPVGDYYAVDYVAHEMGHEFGGNHTFNGTQVNCSGGNRNAGTSVEPGSGSSIMAYAGICASDNLQPHSDPYFSQRSYDEITTYTSSARPAINEVQTASLTGFDGTDSLTLGYAGHTTNPIVNGTNYTAAAIQAALQGPSEVQAVALTGYDTDGDSYTLNYGGVNTVPIVRGQNNTAAGIQNALQGGNEQQAVTLGSFNGTSQSFQVQIGGQNSAVLGSGGTTISNNNLAAAINAISGFAGTVSVSGAGNTGFTVTFGGASANTDVPSISIVNCTGGCTSSVRETAKGGAALSSWPAGGTVTASNPTDAGYTLTFGGNLQGTDVAPVSVTNGNGASGTVTETTKGAAGILPAGATATVAGFGGGTFDTTGFQITFGGTMAGQPVDPLALNVTGATGFIGETARGGAIQNQGWIQTVTGNHAPVVTTAAGYTIPTRTPFALTGSATDSDNDPLTYMWEQNDRGSTAGTALVSNTKKDGPLFRQFGVAAQVSATDTLTTPSPGENHVDGNPTRVFPDMAQILTDNTDAATGTCPTVPTTSVTDSHGLAPQNVIDCMSEFLPTADWVGQLSDRTMNFRLTARDGHVGGGGVGSAATKLVIAPLAGPFRVTSQSIPQSIYAQSPQTITWDVAGTDVAPISVSNVKITLSTDGGNTFPITIASSAPNTGSYQFVMPNVTASKARLKIEAVGNVFFDVNHADFAIAPAPTSTVGGTVPATLSLTLGTPAAFAPFVAGVAKDYDASTTANVISSAGDATLSVTDPSSQAPGHLVNGTFSLPSALQAKANSGTLADVSGSPLTLLTYAGPVSNDTVALGFRQHIGANDALRTGSYAKTLTFTLSTTQP